MRFGAYGELDEAGPLRDAGFDYLEVHAAKTLGIDVASADYDRRAPDPARLALPVEAACYLLPDDFPLLGPARNPSRQQDALQRLAKRAEQLGIVRLVFGCAAARQRPRGVSADEAAEHLQQFFLLAAQILAHHNLTLCVQPLPRSRTNTLNRIGQVRKLVDAVNHPRLAVCVDTQQYALEHESDRTLIPLGNRLKHVHVCEPDDRAEPGPDGFDIESFFGWLQKIGYRERISVVAGSGLSVRNAAASLRWLKQAWARCGRIDP